MNLIEEQWIPVRMRDGSQKIIAPWEMADDDVMFPDWPRADFNLACLELLIGLVYLACPPADDNARDTGKPSPEALRAAMQPLIPAFHLTGDGPRFLQDFDGFDKGSDNEPDMLFIDSAAVNAVKKNQDVMVHRNRYAALDMAHAAMALYTLQNFAPEGGAGNLTSIRGGGPLVTLVSPKGANLCDLVWENVPIGVPLRDLKALPWMRPIPAADPMAPWPDPMAGEDYLNPEVFFGQPRRIQLSFSKGLLVKVQQLKRGNNYVGWRHPLSPYYFDKLERLPKHPKPGRLSYSSWMGTLYASEGAELAPRVAEVKNWEGAVSVLIGGWAMSSMKPKDFILSEVPVFALTEQQLVILRRLIDGGTLVARAVASSVSRAMGEKSPSEGHGLRAQTAFYQRTEPELIALIQRMKDQAEASDVLCSAWLENSLRKTALDIFQSTVRTRLLELSDFKRPNKETKREVVINQWKFLRATVLGYGKEGANLMTTLNLPKPEQKGKAA